MLRPSENIITTPHESYYSLVIAVAKRARQITEELEAKGEDMIEKPVDLAVQDFVAGKYDIVEPEILHGKL
ncbi:DNA-directed RNA polymerase subunit omega [Scatolibacter rhodanostii]|uniref:DNA-directed RNA polymerase subunit omega n=1 Tax=Scatolibacter rhodanostii TaxID=2014781 RepID=UPI000C080D72|nr:DNA-directed RNA polymerase subunit omega [Scatolibacter rhodanostii]